MANSPATLVAWLHGRPVADVRRERSGRLVLAYREDVVDAFGERAVCLSVALPVRRQPVRGQPVEYWLEGLLPEGETRTVLEQAFAIRRGDTFGLLAAIGRDCAGAVCFLPPGAAPAPPTGADALEPADIDQAIDDLPGHPLGAGQSVRVSLGGLQAKLLLVRGPHAWVRPAPGVPSTHILKPDPPGMPGLVASEALVLKAAANAGLDAAPVELIDAAGRAVLVVERYDRRVHRGLIERIHQEDGCQSLGIDPSGPRKYEGTSGVPSFRGLAGVLGDHSVDPAAEWAKLGAAMTVSVAVGNTDGHARNISFLIEDGALRLAPMYDVAPTVHFVTTRQVGLRVGGQALLVHITRGHLVREMAGWGLSSKAARRIVNDTVETLGPAVAAAAEELSAVHPEIVAGCLERIRALAASPLE